MTERRKRGASQISANERALSFARFYTSGPDGVRDNGRESARAAGFTGTDRGLDVTASRLLRRPNVVKHIESLRRRADERAVAKLVEWRELVPEAQRTLVLGMHGKLGKAPIAKARQAAADSVLDRALGKPPTKVQLGGDVDNGAPLSLTVRFVPPASS